MTRYLFTCISSALYAGEATVDALLRELAHQARDLYLNGLVEAGMHSECSPPAPCSRGLFWAAVAPGVHWL